MLFNKQTEKHLTKLDIRLFIQVKFVYKIIQKWFIITAPEEYRGANCHIISRVIADILEANGVCCVDGYILGITGFQIEKDQNKTINKENTTFVEHSWLVTPDKNIIDIYPVGIMTEEPILVVTKSHLAYFMANRYQESELVSRKIEPILCYRTFRNLLEFTREEILIWEKNHLSKRS